MTLEWINAKAIKKSVSNGCKLLISMSGNVRVLE